MKKLFELILCAYGLMILFSSESHAKLGGELKSSEPSEPNYQKRQQTSAPIKVDLDVLKDMTAILPGKYEDHRYQISFINDKGYLKLNLKQINGPRSLTLNREAVLSGITDELGERIYLRPKREENSPVLLKVRDLVNLLVSPQEDLGQLKIDLHLLNQTETAQWNNWNNWGNLICDYATDGTISSCYIVY